MMACSTLRVRFDLACLVTRLVRTRRLHSFAVLGLSGSAVTQVSARASTVAT